MKNILALVVAVILGIIATWGFWSSWKTREGEVANKLQNVKVIAAAERIRAGTVVTAQMLTTMDMSKTNVTADHMMAMQDDVIAIGNTITRTVEEGEPLLRSYFRKPEQKLKDSLGHEERAMTLRVDPVSGVAGNLSPGSHVDILATFPAAAFGLATRTTGNTSSNTDQSVALLSNVTILAVDNRTRDTDYSEGQSNRQSYGTVTVAVTPDESLLLSFAQNYGKLTLTLRPDADTTTFSGQPTVNEKNVLDVALQAAKARESRASRPPMEPIPR